jgi:hypothetical protein
VRSIATTTLDGTTDTQTTATALVINVDTTAPTVSSIAFTSNAGTDNAYKAGDIVQVTVTMSEAVVVTGNPRIPLSGLTSKFATFSSGGGTSSLVFTYTIVSGDNDADGLAITANALELNGGTIADTASNNATLTHSAVAASSTHTVDTTAPTVTITRSGLGTVAAGQTATITFTLSESATDFVAGDITTTGGTLSALSGSGTTYTATYTPTTETSGTATFTVAIGTFTDPVGNTNTAGGTLNVAYDTGVLLAKYDASKSASYGGSGATTWTDLTGSGRDAALVGSPVPVAATSSAARSISLPTNSFGTLHNRDFSNFSGGITVQATLNFGNVDTWERIVDFGRDANGGSLVRGDAAQYDNIFWSRDTATNNLVFVMLNGSTEIARCSAANAILNNTVANYAVTLSFGGSCQMYQNGTAISTTTSIAYNTRQNIVTRNSNFIGRSNWTADGDINGSIRSLYIYNRAISASDVLSNYNAERQFTITYNDNNSTSGVVPSSTTYTTTSFTSAGTAATVAANTGTLAKTGLGFGGWNTAADGSGTNYPAGSGTYQVANDITLYAQWNDITAPTPTLTTASIRNTQSATGQSTETGTLYLVNSSVSVANLASITGAADNLWNSASVTAINTDITISAAGLADGTYRLYAIDASNNLSSASTNSVTIDTTAPTVTSVTFSSTSGSDSTYKIGDVVDVTIAFSENVTITASPRISLTGLTSKFATYSSGSGTSSIVFSYTVVSGDSDTDGLAITSNTLALNSGTIADAFGNNATLTHSAVLTQASQKVDGVVPTVSLSRAGSGVIKAGQTETITFTFTESVTGFTLDDVSRCPAGASTGTLSNLSGSGTSYTATFTPTANVANGTAALCVGPNTFADVPGNENTTWTSPLTISTDTTVPTVTITRAGSGTLKSGQTETITFTLSEASSNFIAGDITVSGGSIGTLTTTSSTVYSVVFTPTPNTNSGTGSISVASAKFTDANGNDNTASNTMSISFDTAGPTVSISASPTSVSSGSSTTLTFTVSETTTTFAATDVSATLGTITGFTGSGTSYTATFTSSRSSGGTAVITVASGSLSDAETNSNSSAFTLNVTVTNTSSSSGGRTSYLANGSNGTNGVRYFVERFTTTGSTTWTVPQGVTSVDLLVAGGGGGGGSRAAGGGGGGGVATTNGYSVTPGQVFNVSVGAGGAGAANTSAANGSNGSPSSFLRNSVGLTANGGGGGKDHLSPGFGAGGASGTASGTGAIASNAGGAQVIGPSCAGNWCGGGGGGAGAVGGNATSTRAGNGGAGTTSTITGSLLTYAGGGGGGSGSNSNTPTPGGSGGDGGGGNGATASYPASTCVPLNGSDGTTNLGGGGGAAGYCITPNTQGTGGNGGSGIVVVRYAVPATTTPVLDTTDDTGINTDNITSATTLTFTGSAPFGATIQLLVDGVASGNTCVADSITGVWTCDTAVLTAGSKVITAESTTILSDSTVTSTSSSLTVTIDPTSPTISSVSFTSNAGSDNSYKIGDVITVAVAFSENVTVTNTPRIALAGLTNKFATYTSGSGTSTLAFSYTVAASDSDTDGLAITADSLGLNGGTISDTAANNATLSHSAVTTQSAHRVDGIAPTITIARAGSGSLQSGDTETITFTLSEASSDFAAGDITISGGTIGTLTTTSSTVYSVVFTPTANTNSGTGSISVSGSTFTDTVGNNNTASSTLNISYDTSAPTVSITRAGSGSLKSGQTDTITFTLSEASSNFTVGDITISGGTIGTLTTTSPTVYSVVFTPTANTNSGTGSISVSGSTFTDTVGNNNTASNTLSINYDTSAPTVDITRAGSSSLKSGETETITFTLSESSANFISTDITVSGGSISGFTGSGTSYTATFTPTANTNSGTGSISVAGATFTDTVGNNNTASNTLSINYDTGAPIVSISASPSSVSSGAATTVTFTINEATTTFTSSDVSATLGTLTGFSGSGTSYTATFTGSPSTGGTAVITVASGSLSDSSGNANTTSFTLNITVTNTSSSTGGRTSYLANGSNGTNGVRYFVERFTTVGTTSWIAPRGVTNVEYLVIAGGGGGAGGHGGAHGGGGGGAGGYRTNASGQSSGGGATAESAFAVTPGTSYTVVVGAGGTSGAVRNIGGTGGNSQFGTITALGGGGGGSYYIGPTTGGSGGGAGASSNLITGANGTTNQGFKGGNTPTVDFTTNGAGGGGSGGVGENGVDTGPMAAGGAGTSSSITGTSVTRAAGGSGGVGTTSAAGATATSNTGNGGSGGSATGNVEGVGGIGGSGIVVVRYAVPATTTPVLDTTDDTGNNTDNITSATTLTFTGSAPVGATIQLLVDGVASGNTCVADSITGVWTCDTAVLTAGSKVITAESTTILSDSTVTSTSSSLTVTIDPTSPTISSVSFTSNAGSDNSYKIGDVITVAVAFSENVTVTNTPRIALAGLTNKFATYTSGSGTSTLAFSYTVAASDSDTDGLAITADSLGLNGGTISDTAANNATLSHSAVTTQSAHRVDGIAPTVSNVTSSTANGTIGIGSTVSIQVTFSEAVTVDGAPRLTLETGTTDRTASFASGSGTNTLTFEYTVQSGDTASDLDYASTSALVLNGSTIVDAVGNNATLTLPTPGASGSLAASKAIVVASAPTQIISVRTPTGAASGAAFSPQPQVSLQDTGGSVVSSDNTTVVTATVSAGASLVGTRTATAVNGIVTFSNLGISGTAGTQYTITYSATVSGNALTSATQLVTPTVGAATQIAVSTQPVGDTAGALLSTFPRVSVLDSGDNVVTSASTSITVSASGGVLGGTKTVNAVNGVATFGDLTFAGTASTNYTLSFATTSLGSATSNNFSVGVGAATKLAITAPASGAAYNENFTTQPEIEIRDAGDNKVTTATNVVTATLSSGTVVGSNNATLTATATNGTATFNGLGITGLPGSYTITYSSGVLTNTNQSISVVKANQTISFTAPTDRQWSASSFAVTPTASSGLNVTVASTTTNICTVAGFDITMVTVGTCSITATQTGNDYFNAANTVSRSFVISQASQTITFAAPSDRPWSANTFTLTPSASSGLTVSLASTTTPVCTVSTFTITMLKAGTCTLSATQTGNTIYSAANAVSRSFEIGLATQQSLTITSTTATFSTTLTLTTSGGSGSGSVTFTKVSGDCSINGTALTPTAAGSCVVTATKAADTQYDATSDTQTITINRADQSTQLTLALTTVIYGQTLSLSGSGGNGNGAVSYAISSGTCTLNGSTLTPGDAASLCEVEITRAQSANYNALTSSPIAITIQRATPTVGSLILSRQTFGNAPFSITSPSADYNSASVAGTWSYASAQNSVATVNGSTATITGGGTSVITATFSPTDSVNFTTATTNATLTVDKATPTFSWSDATATFNDPDITIVSPIVATTAATGTWSYISADTSVVVISGTKFDVGNAGTTIITATFTPNNTTNYVSGGTINMTFTVERANQATLNISSVIGTYGTELTLTTSGGTTNGSVTWGVSNGTASACSITSGKLSTTTAGTCIVTATMAGNSNYNAVVNAGTIVTISQAQQSSLSVTTSSITYRTPIVLQATGGTEGDLSFSIVSPGTAGCSLENDTLSATGVAGSTCTVTATRAATNNYFQKTSSVATITVVQRAITVTANAQQKIYGDADPVFTYVVTSGSLFGSDSFTGSLGRDAGENTGSYNITRGTLANPNYVVTFQSAQLTIIQRPITVTAANKTKIFGQSDPTLTFTITSGNLVGSDSLNGSITRAVGETLGSYNITRGTLDNDRYNITFVTGTFQIFGAPQSGFSLTASSNSVTYQQTVTLQTTGGNGNGAISYATQSGTGACSVAGNSVTGDLAGTCTVTAIKAAEGGYLEATSNSITITIDKATQSITFASIADHDFSATAMTVSPTSNSGAPVILDSRTPNVCTTENSGIVMKFSGTCTLTADVPESRNHTAASTVVRSFEIRAVTPFAPTITSVDPGDTTVTVAFTAGLHGGASITTYRYSVNDGAQWTELPNGTSTSPLIIGNLPNNVEAKVRIMAVNRVGAGAQSNMRAATPVAKRAPIWEAQRKVETETQSSTDAAVASMTNQLPPRPAVVRTLGIQGGRRTQVIATRAARDVNIPVTHAIISVRLKNGKLLTRIQVRVDPSNPTTTITVPYQSSRVNISVQFANHIGLSPGGSAGTNISEGNTLEWTTVEGSASIVGSEVPGQVMFAPGSSQLTYTTQQALKKMVATIKKRGGLVYVTGFAQLGERRSAWTLEPLARARAEAVSKYLSRLGVRQWITFNGTTTKATNGWKTVNDRRVVVSTVHPTESSSSVSS